MYASISIYQLIWAFTEPAFQSIIIFDLGSGETYYNGLMEDYDGPDFEICSIDNLGVPKLMKTVILFLLSILMSMKKTRRINFFLLLFLSAQ